MILVTGARGLLGRRVCSAFRKNSTAEVDVVDESHSENYYCVDLCDEKSVKRLSEIIKGDRVKIIHLAGLKRDIHDMLDSDWGKVFEANTRPLENLIEAFGQRICHITFASTMSVYGDQNSDSISEDTLPHPNGVYGLSKLACEHLLRIQSGIKGFKFCSLRISSVYEEGNYSKALQLILSSAKTKTPFKLNCSCSTRRDYVHIDDVVEAVRVASDNEIDDTINIGGGEKVSFRDVANVCGAHLEESSDLERKDFCLDITKGSELYGFAPRHSILQGLQL